MSWRVGNLMVFGFVPVAIEAALRSESQPGLADLERKSPVGEWIVCAE